MSSFNLAKFMYFSRATVRNPLREFCRLMGDDATELHLLGYLIIEGGLTEEQYRTLTLVEMAEMLQRLVRPRWDSSRRELWFGHRFLKRFTQPATNQTLILDVFQEEGWPARIDNPIAGRSAQGDQRERLKETVKSLNASVPVMHFRLDGTGEGVVWDLGERK